MQKIYWLIRKTLMNFIASFTSSCTRRRLMHDEDVEFAKQTVNAILFPHYGILHADNVKDYENLYSMNTNLRGLTSRLK